MKKLVSMLLLAAMVMAFAAGCGSTNTEPVGGMSAEQEELLKEAGILEEEESEIPEVPEEVNISEEQRVFLEEAGYSEEDIRAMSEEERQELMEALGIPQQEEARQATEAPKEAPKTYTTDDVAAGGNYRVYIGDSMGWNSYTLYYEDGKLVKAEISFMKNDMEPEENYLYEGDTIEEFWYYDMTLDELITYFDDNGYGYETRIYPMD